ncbi:hypothetical protein TGAM01_v205634 [Trichoderma gamsii]|uniref:Small EDRK-rich factor-like N-terminal domain-containing protein n=1 Tax=Trichoderma gamsii TaxID=398673 RepID=A0A2P4ZM35_9HYPO|nr:hypothetical protein TGAM01_v205634 [Trichoderma gamsii]PON25340.1 hypothetical protein TGAM01_v205634 [Trichoderma gamsii]
MTRGNQRELARAKNAKKEAAKKGGNAKSGSELAKQGESNAEVMRRKQLEGQCAMRNMPPFPACQFWAKSTWKLTNLSLPIADKKKAEQEKAALQAKIESKIKK